MWRREGRMEGDSSLTAALVDVVLHQSYDLLKLVVQLSAAGSWVRLQRNHHLREREQWMITF